MRVELARRLEQAAPGRKARAAVDVLAPVLARGLERPLRLPSGVRVVCVGGATLGGSGKTRVALACTESLADAGARVVLVGHAYRAKPGVARVVSARDRLEEVGDEALVCARALGARAPVVVAPSRQDAVDFAMRARPDVIVIDGPLQTRPVRASLGVLAVDARAPWGSGAIFPLGDLRARPADLLACADVMVEVDATPDAFLIDGERLLPDKLSGLTLGLFTAIARPDRLASALAALGLRVAVEVAVRDHGPLDDAARKALGSPGRRVDAWIATPKCATHLEGTRLSAPLLVVSSRVDLPEALPSTWERFLHS